MKQLLMSALVLSSLVVVAAAEKTFHSTLPLIPHRIQEERRRRLAPQEFVDYTPVERPQHYQSKRQLKGTAPLQVGALYQGYGTHYVDLWVGTPPQRQTVIVDTGSGVTAFPCSGCTDCGLEHHAAEKFFVEAESSTFQKVACNDCKRGSCSRSGGKECRIGMSYQEGSSWTAYEARDQSYIGGPHDHGLIKDDGGTSDLDPNHASAFSFELMFGCQYKLTGLFKTQLADGIMGQDNASSSFWSQMYKAGILKTQEFSLCFSRQPTANRDGTESGAMTMGGFDERLQTSPMVYTTNKQYRSGFFSVHIRHVYLRAGGGGDSVASRDPKLEVITLGVSENDLNRGNVIVDSGTTDTYFNRRIASEFNKAFQKLTGKSYSHTPVSLTAQELEALPTIIFQITGDDAYNQGLFKGKDASNVVGLAKNLDPDHPYDVLVAMPPSHYMEWDTKKQMYIARFYVDEGSGTVLGGNAIMGHDVYFDIDNQRIGFAESDCDYTNLVKDNGFPTDGLPDKTSGGGSKPAPAPSPSDDKNKNQPDVSPPAPSPSDDKNKPDVSPPAPSPSDDKNKPDSGKPVPKPTPSPPVTPPIKPKPTDDKGGSSGDSSSHEHDKPADDIHKPTIHPAVAACSDVGCRVGVVTALAIVLICGCCIGKCCFGRGGKEVAYQPAELEMNGGYTDEDAEFGQYKDDPEEEVAPPGSGYKDEPETPEIT